MVIYLSIPLLSLIYLYLSFGYLFIINIYPTRRNQQRINRNKIVNTKDKIIKQRNMKDLENQNGTGWDIK